MRGQTEPTFCPAFLPSSANLLTQGASSYRVETLVWLCQKAKEIGITVAVNKQLVRFGIAASVDDPDLFAGLSKADPALLQFLGDRLALAIFNAP